MDELEAGEEEGELLAWEDVAVESDFGGLPVLDDGEEVGDASCVLDDATGKGQLETSLLTLVVFSAAMSALSSAGAGIGSSTAEAWS